MDTRYYDYLTGLQTPPLFLSDAARKKDQLFKDGLYPAILFLSLAGMKSFNKKFGFLVGDDFLKSFANLLTDFFGNEQCCRIGGVYFTVFTEDKNLEFTLRNFFEECKKLTDEENFSVHAGIYHYQTENVCVDEACGRARLACDTLKNVQSFEFTYFNPSMREAEENKLYIIENIDKAIAERWITVYYQPIVRAVSGMVCDEESLARWIDPVKGFMSPADFIPILEEANLIYKLDLYVIEQAIEKIKYLESIGLYPVPQSVNLSRSDFETCDIVSEVCKRIDAAGISHDKLNIEITESVVGSNFDFMLKQIIRFKELGFSVWMDDFGSGYSSLTVLKEIPFDLIKFDMSFLRQFNRKDNGKAILTGLMKMAFSLGVDTVSEGVETEEQLQFLREIGCSKIQGFYYGKPAPLNQIMTQFEAGEHQGYENPKESGYYETIGRVNLHDIAIIAQESKKGLHNLFNALPMAIIEFDKTVAHIIRSNPSYQDFIERYFSASVIPDDMSLVLLQQLSCTPFLPIIERINTENLERTFFDAALPDNSAAHYFIRKLADNPVTKKTAFAVAVLSVMDAEQGSTYENIARALAADYFNLFYVNLETEEFIEYTSTINSEGLSIERHDSNFFEKSKNDALKYLYSEDQEAFVKAFTKKNVLRELDEQGTFMLTYRIANNGYPFYVCMKVMRMQKNGKYIIVGVSNIDSQMKQREQLEKARQEKLLYSRLMALSGDYICIYFIDLKTDHYTEYNSSSDYEKLGIAKQGEDFFATSRKNADTAISAEDRATFKERFNKEFVLSEIAKKDICTMHHHLLIDGKATPVNLRMVLVKEDGEDKLIVGVRLKTE